MRTAPSASGDSSELASSLTYAIVPRLGGALPRLGIAFEQVTANMALRTRVAVNV